MAKKEKKQSKKVKQVKEPENMLPQNIMPVGERVEEDKNIYISQSVYKEIQKFTRNKTTDESGGMLVGTVIEEFGKTNIVISGFVEAKYSDATPTTLKFTHETWDYVHKQIDKKHKGKKIVGWIHTHPDFGIFLSEYDKFIHENFFSEAHQVAYVVDPIQHIEGFYFWINGNIEKCKGFYIYDKTGVQITVDVKKEEEKEETAPVMAGSSTTQNILIALLSVVVVFLIFSNISANNRLKEAERQIMNLYTSTNTVVGQLNQKIEQQASEIAQQATDIETLAGMLTTGTTATGSTEEDTYVEETDEPQPGEVNPDEETQGEVIEENTEETEATETSADTDPVEEGTAGNE